MDDGLSIVSTEGGVYEGVLSIMVSPFTVLCAL